MRTRSPTGSRRLSSLPARVGLVVLLAILVRGLVVSWASLDLARDFFRYTVERSFPAQVSRTASRVDAWLAAGRGQIELLARDSRVSRAGRGGDPDAASAALARTLATSGILESIWVTDPLGEVRVAEGSLAIPSPLPANLMDPGLHRLLIGERVLPLVSQPLVSGGGWLVGVYSEAALRRLLTGDSLPGVGRGYITDAAGRVLFRGSPRDEPDRVPASLALLLDGVDAPSVEYTTTDGRSGIGMALPLEHLGWHVAVVAHLDEGFDLMKPLLVDFLLLDLALIFVVAWVAYRLTIGLVHPLDALCEAARRISDGDLNVDVPESRGEDEIGTLTRSFNDMAKKLRDDQVEIDAGQRQLRDQNQALQAANEVLAQLSITDGLTKLHNHRFFQDHLTRELKRVKRSGDPLTLLLVDIDDFKALNDRYGHATGDAVLTQIGQVMNSAVRESDLLARYGGEEFVVLADTDLEGAVRLAEKLRMAIQEGRIPVEDSTGEVVSVTVSVGVARYKADRKAFFRDADRALYAAKAAGKNCVVVDAEVY